MSKNKTRILLASPTYDEKDYCMYSWVKQIEKNFSSLTDILIVDTSKNDDFFQDICSIAEVSEVVKSTYHENPYKNLENARKLIQTKLIEGDYDYLFSVESDIFPEQFVLKTLLDSGKKIIGVPYILCYSTDPETNLKTGYIFSTSTKDKFLSVGGKNTGSFQHTDKTIDFNNSSDLVYHVGMGCTLIDAKIYKDVEIKSDSENKRFDDSLFFEDLNASGVDVYSNNTLAPFVKHYPNFKKLVGWKND